MKTRIRGTVRRYDEHRYFGYICGDDGSDTFIGGVSLRESGVRHLQQNDRVEFSVGTSSSGRKQAIDIVRLLPGDAQ